MNRIKPARWLLIGIILFVAGSALYQWTVRRSHALAVARLDELLQAADEGTKDLEWVAVGQLLGSTTSVGPIAGDPHDVVVHHWNGPLKDYSIRLFIDEGGHVVAFDEAAVIPRPRTADPPDSRELIHAKAEESTSVWDIDDLIITESIPELGKTNKPAREELRRLLGENWAATLLPTNADTILAHQFAQRRLDWYRKAWIDSFKEYSTKDPQWFDQAEELLERSVAARSDGPEIPFAVKVELRRLGMSLLDAGCDDALVEATLLDILDKESPEYGRLHGQISESFLNSDYPASVAFWAGCPNVNAEQLLQIQRARGRGAKKKRDSPFDVSDPVEMRVVLELCVFRYQFKLDPPRCGTQQDRELLLALGNNPSGPSWLRNMILAYCGAVGSLDDVAVMTMVGDQAPYGSREFRRVRSELEAEGDFPRQLLNARFNIVYDHLLTAWHDLPTNPEPAAIILSFMVANEFRARVGPEESPPLFWLKQALQAQFDYAPAFRSYQTFDQEQYHNGLGSTASRMARECLDSMRFDTTIPTRYLRYLDFTASHQALQPTFSAPPPEAKRSVYSRPDAYRGVQAIVAGYEANPPPGVDLRMLQSHLACAAFLARDLDRSMALIEQLGPEINVGVFASFRFSPREIERESLRATTSLPFDIGPGNSVESLAFARDENSLICLDQTGQLRAVNSISGVVSPPFEVAERVHAISIPAEGEHVATATDAGPKLGGLEDLDSQTARLGSQLIPVNGDNDAQRYWATVERSDDGSGMRLTLRSFETGEAEHSFSTGTFHVNSLTIAADAPLLAAGGMDSDSESGKLRPHVTVWNYDTGELLASSHLFSLSVDGLSISPDGTAVAVGGRDVVTNELGQMMYERAVLRLINCSTGECHWAVFRTKPINVVQFLSDGRHVLSAEDDRAVHVWDRESGRQLAVFAGHNSPIRALAYSSGRQVVATGDSEGIVWIWEIGSHPERHRAHGFLGGIQLPFVQDLSVDPLTEDFLTCTSPEGVIRWKKDSDYRAADALPVGRAAWTEDGRPLFLSTSVVRGDPSDQLSPKLYSIDMRGAASRDQVGSIQVESTRDPQARLFPDGKSLLTTGTVATVWNLQTGEPHRWGLLTGHRAAVDGIDVSDDGRRVATRANPPRRPLEVKVWELPGEPDATGAVCHVIFDHAGAGYAYGDVELSGDGRFVMINVGFKQIEVWDVDAGELIGSVPGRRARFSPDGKQLAVATGGPEIRLHEAISLDLLRTITTLGNDPRPLVWGPQGKSLGFAASGWVSYLDLETGRELIPMGITAVGGE